LPLACVPSCLLASFDDMSSCKLLVLWATCVVCCTSEALPSNQSVELESSSSCVADGHCGGDCGTCNSLVEKVISKGYCSGLDAAAVCALVLTTDDPILAGVCVGVVGELCSKYATAIAKGSGVPSDFCERYGHCGSCCGVKGGSDALHPSFSCLSLHKCGCIEKGAATASKYCCGGKLPNPFAPWLITCESGGRRRRGGQAVSLTESETALV